MGNATTMSGGKDELKHQGLATTIDQILMPSRDDRLRRDLTGVLLGVYVRFAIGLDKAVQNIQEREAEYMTSGVWEEYQDTVETIEVLRDEVLMSLTNNNKRL